MGGVVGVVELVLDQYLRVQVGEVLRLLGGRVQLVAQALDSGLPALARVLRGTGGGSEGGSVEGWEGWREGGLVGWWV